MVADTGAKFATVVCPATLGQSEDAAAVHGITVEELQSAPPFPVAFERFCYEPSRNPRVVRIFSIYQQKHLENKQMMCRDVV